MAAMLVMVAFVVDIGKAYLVQRQLQAGVDAAALAGAQHLPDPTEATTIAQDYGPSASEKNEVKLGDNVTTTVTMRCVVSAPGCNPTLGSYNAVKVHSTSDVSLLFARILGIHKLKVKATATACSPCSAKPVDVMVVLDRTGSMCQFNDGRNDPNCTDLNTAKGGIREFLRFMDKDLDWVGLSVFPPVLDKEWLDDCVYVPWEGNPSGPKPDGRRYGYDARWPSWSPPPGSSNWAVYDVASITNDYLSKSGNTWVLNSGSALIQQLDCAGGAGTTQYANAIDAAQHELGLHGRGDVQDVIVFLSDGAANTTPRDLPSYMDNPNMRLHPCAAGVAAANHAKAQGTIVYTIGYDLEGQSGAYENCKLYPSGNNDSSITAWDAIRSMASEPDNFYDLTRPNPQAMNRIFMRIAADLQRPASRLIDDDTP
jgi:Flp pilus assembly protein TadG